MGKQAEKFYVIAIILVGLVILGIALVSGFKAITGSGGGRPAYESAAPPFITGVPSFQIIDESKLNAYPITDTDFYKLHRTTRLLARTIAGLDTTPSDFAADATSPETAATISSTVNHNRNLVANTTTNITKLDIKVLQNKPRRARTTFEATYNRKDVSAPPTIIVYTLFFKQAGNNWRVTDVKTTVS